MTTTTDEDTRPITVLMRGDLERVMVARAQLPAHVVIALPLGLHRSDVVGQVSRLCSPRELGAVLEALDGSPIESTRPDVLDDVLDQVRVEALAGRVSIEEVQR